jgi:catechol 2,3-dioxygenase-like lactoylglutathione lyase family enzyme
MLGTSMFYPTLPASDIGRARRFYEETLGFDVIDNPLATDDIMFKVGDGLIFLYKTEASRGENTALFFVVDDLDKEMAKLRDQGVVFEDYDFPGLKTIDGVAELDGMRGAWFKDSEGNILSIGEPSEEQRRVMIDALQLAGVRV